MEPPFREVTTTGLGLWLRRVLRPGRVMIDVGANVGDYSALAAHIVGPGGHVYAFEPGPDNLIRLQDRLAHLGNVSIVGSAVCDKPGTATFFLDCQNSTQHSLAADNTGRVRDPVTVQTVNLDQYLDQLSRLDVLKIDAQGAEVKILRGGRQLLTRFMPWVTLELWPFGLKHFDTDPGELLDELKALGYGMCRLSAKGGLKPEHRIHEFLAADADRWRHINLVAVPPDA